MKLPQEILFKVIEFIDINTRLILLKKIYNESRLINLVNQMLYKNDEDRLELFEFLKRCVELIQPILINYCDITSRYSSYYPLTMDYYDARIRFSRAYISYFKEMIKTVISSYHIIYDKIKYRKNRNAILGCKSLITLRYDKLLRTETHPLRGYITDDFTQEQVEKIIFTLILRLTRYKNKKITEITK
jgi:hypothetical protein